MTAPELAGARKNAKTVEKISNQLSAQWLLAKALLLIIQYLEKHDRAI